MSPYWSQSKVAPCGRVFGRAAIGLVVVVAAAIAALVANPVTGPEIRSYLLDRYLRPWARLPGSR